MAITRTATGVEGKRDATSAARALASVTTSAHVPGAEVRITTARSPRTVPIIFMSVAPFPRTGWNPVLMPQDGRRWGRRQAQKMDLPAPGAPRAPTTNVTRAPPPRWCGIQSELVRLGVPYRV